MSPSCGRVSELDFLEKCGFSLESRVKSNFFFTLEDLT